MGVSTLPYYQQLAWLVTVSKKPTPKRGPHAPFFEYIAEEPFNSKL